LIDIFCAVVLAYATIRGWFKGVLRAVAGLVAPVAGFVAALRWSEALALVLEDYVDLPDGLAGLRGSPVPWHVAGTEAPSLVLWVVAVPVLLLGTVVVVRIGARIVTAVLGLAESPAAKAAGALVSAGAAAVALGTFGLLFSTLAGGRAAADAAGAERLLGDAAFESAATVDESIRASRLGPPLIRIAAVFLETASELQRHYAPDSVGAGGDSPGRSLAVPGADLLAPAGQGARETPL
jgi:hypothetical protein